MYLDEFEILQYLNFLAIYEQIKYYNLKMLITYLKIKKYLYL